MNQFGKFPNNQKQEEAIYSAAKLPENLLPKVNFWNSVLTESDIEQIQLDAMKEGMRRAIPLLRDACYEGIVVLSEAKKVLLAASDELASKDL